MAMQTTPAMDQLLAAADAVLAEDPVMFNDFELLGNADALITLRNRFDYALSGVLSTMWTNDTTVDAFGQPVKAWLHQDEKLSKADAGKRVFVARALAEHPVVAGAFKAGEISLDHAMTLTQTVPTLPVEAQEVAEKELTDAAKFVDPVELAKACKELRDHLGLNGTAEERYAKLYGQRYLKTATTIDGMVKLDAMLDADTGAALKAALTSLGVKQGADDDRSRPQRDHDAFAGIVGYALRSGDLPDSGGEPPQVVVTVTLDQLIDGLDPLRGPLNDENGHPLTPGRIRLMACDAGIIPAVMRGKSDVLDLGRASRTWNRAQRRAAKLRDGKTCGWPGGCTIPIRFCDLHHILFWALGGHTDHDNGIHLCTFHHWLVHNKEWELFRDEHGVLQCRRT
jgi:hypothetical protein